MANDTSTIQSLKAVDAWIDVINANINGGVRTAFKSSRLKFGGSNVNIGRAGNATSLPLQIPETGLMTANSVIDFSQGAITTSTENSHLAIQGSGWFCIVDPTSVVASGYTANIGNSKMLITRDGEFHTDSRGLLVTAFGWYVTTHSPGFDSGRRLIYNDIDIPTPNATLSQAVKLSDFLANRMTATNLAADNTTVINCTGLSSLTRITQGEQSLKYSQYGSTVFDFGFVYGTQPTLAKFTAATTADATVLSKSLEASNASMTQSVPELSLAQKLFSALTKVLQISQTNTDAVLNLIR